MTRKPDDDRGTDPFRAFGRMVENVADAMDAMLGPYGSVDATVRHERGTRRAGTDRDVPVDVQEAGDEIRVVADLPGVTAEDIEVRSDGKRLWITAEGDRRAYSERVRLPARVDEDSATASYNNGVLEVTLAREDGGATIDVE